MYAHKEKQQFAMQFSISPTVYRTKRLYLLIAPIVCGLSLRRLYLFVKSTFLCMAGIAKNVEIWNIANKWTNSYLDWSSVHILEFRVDPVSQVFPGWESPL